MMGVTSEELAAFADGELDPARRAELAAAIAADPALAEEVRAHLALKAQLRGHFAPILDSPLPESLLKPLQTPPTAVTSIAAARARHRARSEDARQRMPRWTWLAAPALAASLALAVFLPRAGDGSYAAGPLAETLDRQLAATQDAGSPTRILLSFRDEAGAYCRVFAATAQSGIACRDDRGWRVVLEGKGMPAQGNDYRMAGNPAAEILERAQEMAAGPALDEVQEQAALDREWRPLDP